MQDDIDVALKIKENLRNSARDTLKAMREESEKKKLNANNWKNFTFKACEVWNSHKLPNMQGISLSDRSTKLTPRDFKYLKEIYDFADRDMVLALNIIQQGLEFSRTVDYLHKQKIVSFSNVASNNKLIDWYKSQVQLNSLKSKESDLLDTSLSIDPLDVIYKGEVLARILGRIGDKYKLVLSGGAKVTASKEELQIVNDIKWYRYADENFSNSKGYKEYEKQFEK